MRRISAIFIAVCMVLIAGSIGAVLYLAVKLDAGTSAIVALAALTAMALVNTVRNRLRDRGDVGDQIADLSRGTADLARQVAEMSRRLAAVESRVEGAVNKARGAVDPIAAEIGELGGLVRQIADTVASHAAVLQQQGTLPAAAGPPPAAATDADGALTLSESDAVDGRRFRSLSREGIVELIGNAVDAHRIDLYLQPIVTLPQRKVRYYEALTRLRDEDETQYPPEDYRGYAEEAGLTPAIDNLMVFRCVQVVRRLSSKNREVGLFCNFSSSTLVNATVFQEIGDFLEANRAVAPFVIFQFAQSAVRAMGPIETEALAGLAALGFRFSMDQVSDLRIEPRELAERGFRFIKASASLLLSRAAAPGGDIHPADFSDLLGRFGIDLIAEKIERESTVVDLLDYDVRFGQGALFSPPRPVRTEVLQGLAERAQAAEAAPAAPAERRAPSAETDPEPERRVGAIAQLARGIARRA